MQPPTVSVVVPAYDVEDWIERCVTSALGQVGVTVEVIVVDDGSHDATVERIPNDPRVHVVRQANAGPAAARNRGLAVARGEVIALLDSDDAWSPTRLERCLAALDAHPEWGFVTTDARIVDDGEPTDRTLYRDVWCRPFPTGDLVDAMLEANIVFSGVVARRELFERHGAFLEDRRYQSSEDYELWLRWLLAGEGLGFIDEPLADYSVRAGNLTSMSTRQQASHLAVLDHHLDALARRRLAPHLAPVATRIGHERLRRGERGPGLRALLLGVRADRGGARLRRALAVPRVIASARRHRHDPTR
jgi:glycosyltransferase involved in cell wall biosynthesis